MFSSTSRFRLSSFAFFSFFSFLDCFLDTFLDFFVFFDIFDFFLGHEAEGVVDEDSESSSSSIASCPDDEAVDGWADKVSGFEAPLEPRCPDFRIDTR